MTDALTTPGTSAFRFDAFLQERGCDPLRRRAVTTVQVNVGKLCNQACHHCHVEAGPKRTEVMEVRTADRVLELLERSPEVELVDITGGAPEMNPHFRSIVARVATLGRRVMVRSNLTVLLLEEHADTIPFFVDNGVSVVASLPCYTSDNVDKQRGAGAFDGSIAALRALNDAGYGHEGSGLTLDLVYNPLGAFLPPAQDQLESAYKERLLEDFGIRFNRLYTITNMPIKRFSEMLERAGQTRDYLALLVEHFNASAVPEVMCRDLVSISWDGQLFDCDFNQMVEMPLGPDTAPRSIWDVEDLTTLRDVAIRTDSHCFGCTAGAGSSCSGTLV